MKITIIVESDRVGEAEQSGDTSHTFRTDEVEKAKKRSKEVIGIMIDKFAEANKRMGQICRHKPKLPPSKVDPSIKLESI